MRLNQSLQLQHWFQMPPVLEDLHTCSLCCFLLPKGKVQSTPVFSQKENEQLEVCHRAGVEEDIGRQAFGGFLSPQILSQLATCMTWPPARTQRQGSGPQGSPSLGRGAWCLGAGTHRSSSAARKPSQLGHPSSSDPPRLCSTLIFLCVVEYLLIFEFGCLLVYLNL